MPGKVIDDVRCPRCGASTLVQDDARWCTSTGCAWGCEPVHRAIGGSIGACGQDVGPENGTANPEAVTCPECQGRPTEAALARLRLYAADQIAVAHQQLRDTIARWRGRFGRDWVRALPSGRTLDAIDAGRDPQAELEAALLRPVRDPEGTTRSAWAASIDGGETLWTGDTRDDAIASAMEAAEERIRCGDHDYTPTVEVHVFRDVLWCVGDPPGVAGCYCGGDHSEHRWMAVDFTRDGIEHVDVDADLAECAP